MSVNYTQTVINNRLQQVVNAVDANGHGVLRLLNSGNSTVSSFQLQVPSMTVSAGVATFNGLSLIDPSAVGGTATAARIEDGLGNIVVSGLVVNNGLTPPTPDIVLSPTNVITAGQAVALTAATITGH